MGENENLRSNDGNTSLGADQPARIAECDVARRRRFLKSIAGAGAFVLGGGELSRALAQEPGGGNGVPNTCTTTETYTSSTSSSSSYPSADSFSHSYTGIDPNCSGGPGGSTERPSSDTWAFEGGYGGIEDGVSTWSGSYSQTHGPNGGVTYQDTCVDGTFSRTNSYGSRPAWTKSYSATESGTMTVTCGTGVGGHMANLPRRVGDRKIVGTLPPHLDPDHELHRVVTRPGGQEGHWGRQLNLPR